MTEEKSRVAKRYRIIVNRISISINISIKIRKTTTCEVTEVNFYTFLRLQELDSVLESIFGRSSWISPIENEQIELLISELVKGKTPKRTYLHTITSTHKLKRMHEFYIKLARSVQTLSTMKKKLDCAQYLIYVLMDKLGPVIEIIAQQEDNWKDWNLEQLVENMKRYVQGNRLRNEENDNHQQKPNDRNDSYQRNQNYRGKKNWWSNNTEPFIVTARIIQLIMHKGVGRSFKTRYHEEEEVCFNCTSAGNLASHCKSRPYFECGQKHHASILPIKQIVIAPNVHYWRKNQEMAKVDSSAKEWPTEKSMSGMTWR